MFSSSTDITLSLPARSAPDGIVNERPPQPELPRYVPLSHAAQTPLGPVAPLRDMEVSVPVAVKWPRYQTSPWWKPYSSVYRTGSVPGSVGLFVVS
jgi:hypothetical protein